MSATLFQHLLMKLSEELDEVGQVASKTHQFGWDSRNKKEEFKTNVELMSLELDDVMAVVELLEDMGLTWHRSRDAREAKKLKMLRYLKDSVDAGLVEKEALSQLKTIILKQTGQSDLESQTSNKEEFVYLVHKEGELSGLLTTDKQLAYEVRKESTTNLYDADGNWVKEAYDFVKNMDENANYVITTFNKIC